LFASFTDIETEENRHTKPENLDEDEAYFAIET